MPSNLREAFQEWTQEENIHGGHISKRDFEAGWLACAKHLEETAKDAELGRFVRGAYNELSDSPKSFMANVAAAIAATKGAEHDAE